MGRVLAMVIAHPNDDAYGGERRAPCRRQPRHPPDPSRRAPAGRPARLAGAGAPPGPTRVAGLSRWPARRGSRRRAGGRAGPHPWPGAARCGGDLQAGGDHGHADPLQPAPDRDPPGPRAAVEHATVQQHHRRPSSDRAETASAGTCPGTTPCSLRQDWPLWARAPTWAACKPLASSEVAAGQICRLWWPALRR
jgi:hypothetical protein